MVPRSRVTRSRISCAKVQENRQRVERAKYIEPDASDLPNAMTARL